MPSATASLSAPYPVSSAPPSWMWEKDSLTVMLTGDQSKLDALINLLEVSQKSWSWPEPALLAWSGGAEGYQDTSVKQRA